MVAVAAVMSMVAVVVVMAEMTVVVEPWQVL